MQQIFQESYGGPEVLQMRDVPIPVPTEGEVLIQMKAAGVSKPDHLMRTGNYPWTKGILPFFPGLYGSGVIVAVGKGNTQFHPGQPVYVDHPVVCGCYSEYKVAPVSSVFPLPDGIDFCAAAVSTNYIIAWSMLSHAMQPANGKTLYIRGAAGALGTALVQLAPLQGLRVIASASTEEKCAYLRSLGADTVFCYSTMDEQAAVRGATAGEGADYVMDQCVGEMLGTRLDLLSRCGTVIIYNTLDGYPTENVIRLLTDRYARCPAIRAFSFHLHDGQKEELTELRQTVFGLMAEGKVQPRIGAKFPRQDIVAAHELLESGTCLGSIVMEG